MLWLLLLACTPPGSPAGEHVRIAQVGPPTSLDLVVIADTSGSMQEWEPTLAALAEALLPALPEDLRVGVGDGDVTTPPVRTVVDQPDVVQLQEALRPPRYGSGMEAPLFEAIRALEEPDLLRGGPVAVLFITDEVELSPDPVRDSARALLARAPSWGALSVHALTWSGDTACPEEPHGQPNTRLPAVIDLVGGSHHDLCALPEVAADLAADLSRGRRAIPMGIAPDVDTLRVFLDDVELGLGEGWHLDLEPEPALLVDEGVAGLLRVVWEEAS